MIVRTPVGQTASKQGSCQAQEGKNDQPRREIRPFKCFNPKFSSLQQLTNRKVGDLSTLDSVSRGTVIGDILLISRHASAVCRNFAWGSEVSLHEDGTDLFGFAPLFSCGTPGEYSHCYVYTLLNSYLFVRVASCSRDVYLREDRQVDGHGTRAGAVSVSCQQILCTLLPLIATR